MSARLSWLPLLACRRAHSSAALHLGVEGCHLPGGQVRIHAARGRSHAGRRPRFRLPTSTPPLLPLLKAEVEGLRPRIVARAGQRGSMAQRHGLRE